MNYIIRDLIDKTKEEGLKGIVPSRDTVISLLALDPLSEEADYLKKQACEVAHEVTGNKGRVSGAIGIDFVACSMNCTFCSFGEKWQLVKNDKVFTKEEIIEIAKDFVDQGATTLTLRSTEFYDLDVLNEYLKDIRAAVPGLYEININVGELTPERAEQIYECGATSAYHVLRLREGTDTPFNPEDRKATMRSISDSSLLFCSCVEPIGPEHTNEELADALLTIIEYGACSCGAMARVPVDGTPFEGTEPITEERHLQIIAVVRLCGGNKFENVIVHPPLESALYAGSSGFTVEQGAIPRDVELVEEPWNSFTVADAKAMLEKAGFELALPYDRPRNIDNREYFRQKTCC